MEILARTQDSKTGGRLAIHLTTGEVKPETEHEKFMSIKEVEVQVEEIDEVYYDDFVAEDE